MLQEVRKIWRAISVQSFEGHRGKFEPYTPFDSDDRKPVEKYENAGTRQPEPLHAGYAEDELCA